jgi:sensor histidine kinase regulating citrate/malate metabolism
MSITTAGDTTVLRVADNGPGIDDNELAAFDDSVESALDHASGLGLWLVHWTVAESGGEVTFDEHGPRGTVVTIRLPTTPPDAP